MPSTWKVLVEDSELYGPAFIDRKIKKVVVRLFGVSLTDAEQEDLDPLVADYAGKLLALELINPGMDYWSKQPTSIAAHGRNENKSYNDRAQSLRDLRTSLLEQTRLMWAEVQPLIPNRRFRRVSAVPRVVEVTGAHTPNPYDFERPYTDPTNTDLQ